ncbi:MAG: hypothetical protein DRG80_04215 [Deltaproteobacteria bacterium]|nr:MAG: hypothetical protein DRG80_04215 [Deltaproteobacteria bacterium]RLB85236.1 MAG: hypothetical protein DRH24_02670 [Deltaproteobacteria bacterium]
METTVGNQNMQPKVDQLRLHTAGGSTKKFLIKNQEEQTHEKAFTLIEKTILHEILGHDTCVL